MKLYSSFTTPCTSDGWGSCCGGWGPVVVWLCLEILFLPFCTFDPNCTFPSRNSYACPATYESGGRSSVSFAFYECHIVILSWPCSTDLHKYHNKRLAWLTKRCIPTAWHTNKREINKSVVRKWIQLISKRVDRPGVAGWPGTLHGILLIRSFKVCACVRTVCVYVCLCVCTREEIHHHLKTK